MFALAGFGIGRNKPHHVDQHVGGHSLMGVKSGIREKADRSTENIYIDGWILPPQRQPKTKANKPQIQSTLQPTHS